MRADIVKHTLKQHRIDFKALKYGPAYIIGAPVLIDYKQYLRFGFMLWGFADKNLLLLLSIKRIYLLFSNTYFLVILIFYQYLY